MSLKTYASKKKTKKRLASFEVGVGASSSGSVVRSASCLVNTILFCAVAPIGQHFSKSAEGKHTKFSRGLEACSQRSPPPSPAKTVP